MLTWTMPVTPFVYIGSKYSRSVIGLVTAYNAPSPTKLHNLMNSQQYTLGDPHGATATAGGGGGGGWGVEDALNYGTSPVGLPPSGARVLDLSPQTDDDNESTGSGIGSRIAFHQPPAPLLGSRKTATGVSSKMQQQQQQPGIERDLRKVTDGSFVEELDRRVERLIAESNLTLSECTKEGAASSSSSSNDNSTINSNGNSSGSVAAQQAMTFGGLQSTAAGKSGSDRLNAFLLPTPATSAAAAAAAVVASTAEQGATAPLSPAALSSFARNDTAIAAVYAHLEHLSASASSSKRMGTQHANQPQPADGKATSTIAMHFGYAPATVTGVGGGARALTSRVDQHSPLHPPLPAHAGVDSADSGDILERWRASQRRQMAFERSMTADNRHNSSNPGHDRGRNYNARLDEAAFASDYATAVAAASSSAGHGRDDGIGSAGDGRRRKTKIMVDRATSPCGSGNGGGWSDWGSGGSGGGGGGGRVGVNGAAWQEEPATTSVDASTDTDTDTQLGQRLNMWGRAPARSSASARAKAKARSMSPPHNSMFLRSRAPTATATTVNANDRSHAGSSYDARGGGFGSDVGGLAGSGTDANTVVEATAVASAVSGAAAPAASELAAGGFSTPSRTPSHRRRGQVNLTPAPGSKNNHGTPGGIYVNGGGGEDAEVEDEDGGRDGGGDGDGGGGFFTPQSAKTLSRTAARMFQHQSQAQPPRPPPLVIASLAEGGGSAADIAEGEDQMLVQLNARVSWLETQLQAIDTLLGARDLGNADIMP